MATRGKPTTSFRWDGEKQKKFSRAVSRLEAEGEIDSTADSEVIRAVLEEWMNDPDPSVLDTS